MRLTKNSDSGHKIRRKSAISDNQSDNIAENIAEKQNSTEFGQQLLLALSKARAAFQNSS